jgi:hypothetical protein
LRFFLSSESAKKKEDDPPRFRVDHDANAAFDGPLASPLLSFLSMVVSVETAVRWIRLGVGPLAFWRSVRARREGHLEAHLENLVNLENPVRRTPRGGVLVSRSETLRDAHDITQSVSASAFAAAAVAVGAAAAIATSPAKRLEGEVAEKRES